MNRSAQSPEVYRVKETSTRYLIHMRKRRCRRGGRQNTVGEMRGSSSSGRSRLSACWTRRKAAATKMTTGQFWQCRRRERKCLSYKRLHGMRISADIRLGHGGSVSRLNFRLGPLSFRHCGGMTGALPRVLSRRILRETTATNSSTAVFHGRPKWP